jgi:hypothetical protein
MVAHFYLLAVSFNNNANFRKEEIEDKIMRLSEDINLIRQYKETNKFYVNYVEVYPQILYSTYSVEDFICHGHELKNQGLIERNVLNAFQNIFRKSEETNITFQEIKDVCLSWIDENNCHGLVAFHKIDNFDNDLQIIYGKNEWYKFRRHFLSLYPRDANFFVDECIKYFPDLFFHERNKVSVRLILSDCPKKIVLHLTALNDKFRECQREELNRTQVLVEFSRYAQLDETATLEGNAERKKDFTFSFRNDFGIDEDVCCEPHLKLCYSDTDQSYSNDRRIYFHEGKTNIQNGKILVGHIGKHR